MSRAIHLYWLTVVVASLVDVPHQNLSVSQIGIPQHCLVSFIGNEAHDAVLKVE